MREIKFRAWGKNGKVGPKMWGWGQIHYCFDLWIDDQNDRNAVLMQYTGLKDKNGTEIYEGDIIQHESRNLKETVEWKEEMWTEEGIMTGFGELTFSANQYEIIGNIYENPNLLEYK